MTSTDGERWLACQLFERRVVLCRGTLDAELAGRVAAELMTLDALGDDAIDLQLDCDGNELDPAFTLVDVLDLLGVPVEVTCTGRVEGPAVAVVAAAERSRAMAHTRFRMVDPAVEIGGSASELDGLVAHHRSRIESLHERVAAAVGRSVDEVAEDFAAKRSFDAEEAVAYGLVDEVAGSARTLRSLGGTPGAARRLPDAVRRPLGFESGDDR